MPETLAPPPSVASGPPSLPSGGVGPKAPPTAKAPISGPLPSTSPPPPAGLSSRERFSKALEARAKGPDGRPLNQQPAKPEPKPQSKPAPQAQAELEADAGMDDSTPAETETTAPETETTGQETETKPPEAGTEQTSKPGKKESPWKLLDTYKKRTLALEKQIADIKTSGAAPEEIQTMKQRLEVAENRAKELDQEIKYHDFTKSSEFKTKYQEPYEKAWKNAMVELGELTVDDPITGEARYVTSQDMLELVSLPLGKARDLADSVYGKFADDAMRHRAKIKELFDTQTNAIKEARETASTRDQQRHQQLDGYRQRLAKEVGDVWEKSKQDALDDPKFGAYFKPIEGDTEGNAKLEKGMKFAEEAFRANPLDPKLTPEQRAKVVKRHAVLRFRAAAFGRLTHQLAKERAEHAATKKELAQFRTSEPGSGEGMAQRAPAQLTGMDRLRANLRAKAH